MSRGNKLSFLFFILFVIIMTAIIRKSQINRLLSHFFPFLSSSQIILAIRYRKHS